MSFSLEPGPFVQIRWPFQRPPQSLPAGPSRCWRWDGDGASGLNRTSAAFELKKDVNLTGKKTHLT